MRIGRTIQWILGVWLLLGLSGTVWAGVAGQYLPSGAQARRIRVTVDPPAPRAFIVVQRLPPGARIVKAQPRPAGINAARQVVRWLFKHPQPGSLTIHVQIDRDWPHLKKNIGKILYKKPRGKAMIQKDILPPPEKSRRVHRPGYRR